MAGGRPKGTARIYADRRLRAYPTVVGLSELGLGNGRCSIALGYLKRFGSVTVLNGHIHQLMQKVEGNVTFHTARSTAFPQPAPGTAPSPGPMLVPAEKLRSVLGITSVTFTQGKEALAITDTALSNQ